jgi:hypothetical protein
MINNWDYQATQQEESRLEELHSRRGEIEAAQTLSRGVGVGLRATTSFRKKD